MKRNARERVHHARLELAEAEQQLAARWQRKQFRLPTLISAGLLGGIALVTVSPKSWARVGAALFGGSARLARSVIGPVVISGLWTYIQSGSASKHVAARVAPTTASAQK
jgi:hypothetical protein